MSMFNTEPGSRFRLAASSAAVGFLAGALVVAIAGVIWERRQSGPMPVSMVTPVIVEGAPMMVITPAEPMTPGAVLPPEPDADALPVLEADAFVDLRERHLEHDAVFSLFVR